jgi:hypothetical protein
VCQPQGISRRMRGFSTGNIKRMHAMGGEITV